MLTFTSLSLVVEKVKYKYAKSEYLDANIMLFLGKQCVCKILLVLNDVVCYLAAHDVCTGCDEPRHIHSILQRSPRCDRDSRRCDADATLVVVRGHQWYQQYPEQRLQLSTVIHATHVSWFESQPLTTVALISVNLCHLHDLNRCLLLCDYTSTYNRASDVCITCVR